MKLLQVNSNPISENKNGELARIKPKSLLGISLLIVIVLGFALTNLFGADIPPASALPQREVDAEANSSQNYQFVGQGSIHGGTQLEWVIGKVPVRIDENTQIIGDLHVGDFVTVSGRRVNDHVWVADRIESITGDQSFFTYNGSIERVQASVWKIGGYNLIINSQTEVDGSLKLDDLALVTFFVNQDGAWIATSLQAFDPSLMQPTPTQTPTPKPAKSASQNTPPKDQNKPSIQHTDGKEDHGKEKDKKDKREKDHHKDEDKDHDRGKGKHDD